MSSNQDKEARRALINEIDSLGLRRRPDGKKEYTWEELHAKYGTKSRSELKKKQIERAAELVKQLKEARAELAKAREEKAAAQKRTLATRLPTYVPKFHDKTDEDPMRNFPRPPPCA